MVFSIITGVPQTFSTDSRIKRYRFRNTDFMQQRVMVGRYESTCALWFSHANYIADTNRVIFIYFKYYVEKKLVIFWNYGIACDVLKP